MATSNAVALRRVAVADVCPVQNGQRERALMEFNHAVERGTIRPDLPTNIIFADVLRKNTEHFQHAFPAGTKHMYAVKANPTPVVLDELYKAGITHFDVASQGEIGLVRSRFPDAVLYFMHPTQTPQDIDFAMAKRVKGFVVDCKEGLELLTLHPSFDPAHHSVVVRIKPPKVQGAVMPLDHKFGANKREAIALLKACAKADIKDIGISFHVGSQQMNPTAHAGAITQAAAYAKEAGVKLSTMDVGGGFPAFAAYPHIAQMASPLEIYAARIKAAMKHAGLENVQLLTEPGRALVADAGMLITQGTVKKNGIHLNDGVFGGLFDAGQEVKFQFPTFAFNALNKILEGPEKPRVLWGPTCDSHDRLAGKWNVPDLFKKGDYIAFMLMGAYSEAMRTRFNGVGQSQTLVLR